MLELNFPLIIITTLVVYSIASISYVYAFRGQYRHPNFKHYMRKCWPIFAPLNCILYISTKANARKAILDLKDFPELNDIQANWESIRDEALALRDAHAFESTKEKGSLGYYDVGFRTFFKYGWSKFYLKWYGYTHQSARKQCPKTVALIRNIPQIKGAMFTLLPPGSKLTPHSDPFACSFRYHLGLDTPNDDKCWINVDGQAHSWRDGEALLFDETYVHHVANDTEKHRLILMLDVARPMGIFGRLFNALYCQLMRFTLVPNDSTDERGLANAVFAKVTPFLNRSKQLKQTNNRLYKLLKFIFNTLLIAVLLFLIALIIYIPYRLFF